MTTEQELHVTAPKSQFLDECHRVARDAGLMPIPQTRLAELLKQYPEPWVIEKEPHSYNDGTTEFTHVRYRTRSDWSKGKEVCVEIGSYLTPDLAELLILLRDSAEALLHSKATEAK